MQDHHASCDAATLLDQTRGEPRSLKARCSKCEHLHAADIARSLAAAYTVSDATYGVTYRYNCRRDVSPRPGAVRLHFEDDLQREFLMSWLILFLAGLFEMGWAVGLKFTDGFTRLMPTLWTVLSMIVSLALLGIAMRELPVGTAYAVWTGIGAVGTVILGIALFGESAAFARLLCLGLIVAGIIGLGLVES